MNHYTQAKNLVKNMTIEEKIGQLSNRAPAISRLDIPAYNYWNEGLHGVARAGIASVFPQAIGLAATFNDKLIKKIAYSIGLEARAKYNEVTLLEQSNIYQGITIWSPNINIFRDPRWGRGQETYGEDPCLTSRIATAYIQGLQHKNSQGYRLTDATIKHFFAHSGPENKRHEFNADVNDRDLYDTYLKSFCNTIKHANPAGVMGAYNRVNNQLCCGSESLIHKLLRKDMAFKGYFVSDCWAIEDFHKGHRVTTTPLESAALAFNSGCDLSCGEIYRYLDEALKQNKIKETSINQSLIRLFKTRYRLGMFDFSCQYNQISEDVIDCQRHRKLNLKAAEESIVLLENNGILPLNLKNYRSIAVIGNNVDTLHAILGNYNGIADEPYTIYQGIKKLMSGCVVKKAEGCVSIGNPAPWEFQPLVEAISLAKKSDLVIFALGIDNTMEGEENDAKNSLNNGDKATLYYSESQLKLIDEISKLHKPSILVNISGSPMILPSKYPMDAVLQQFYGGQFAGLALARILLGKANPSGRLPVTFYADETELPDFEDYRMENRTYRYFKGAVQYPFGYGLSYSKFKFNLIECTSALCVLSVSNLGSQSGQNIIMVFASCSNQPEAPRIQLVGFCKVLLKLGEEKRIIVKLDSYSFHDQQGKTVIPTEYDLQIASNHPMRSQDVIIRHISKEI